MAAAGGYRNKSGRFVPVSEHKGKIPQYVEEKRRPKQFWAKGKSK